MPICSYLVIPREGASEALAGRLEGLPGCEVARPARGEVLLLVTDTATPGEDEALRARIEAFQEIQALVLTFGEIDPETPLADPVGATRHRRPGLPVLPTEVRPSPPDPGDS
jgi:hypothetical protein